MLLEGIFLPLTTPFYPDGRLYARKLEHNVDRYSRTPAAGMLVAGPAGEGYGLGDEDARAALAAAMAVAAKEKVMLAAVGRETVAASLAIADTAAGLGYDAVVARGPGFTEEGSMWRETLTYFQALADHSPLPVVLDSEAGWELALDLVEELAGHPNVIGMVEGTGSVPRIEAALRRTAKVRREVMVTTIFAAATGRMLKVEAAGPGSFVSAESLGAGGAALAVAPPKPALKTRLKRVGFQVLGGSTARMLEDWQAGAAGSLPRLGAAAPQVCCEVWQAFKDGDPALAAEKQQRIHAAGKRMESWAGIAAIKHACDLNGYFGGRPRLPLLVLTEEQRAEVEHEMDRLKN